MKAVAIVGSAREGGNTELITARAMKVLESDGITIEIIRLADKTIMPCTHCNECKREETCPLEDDLLPVYHIMKAADAIILASPVYFGSVTGKMKSFLDRAGMISYMNGYPFRRKAGGSIVVAGRNGGNFTNSQFLLWFMIEEMIVPGSTGWNVVFGNEIGEIWADLEGIETIDTFAKNLSWLIKKIS